MKSKTSVSFVIAPANLKLQHACSRGADKILRFPVAVFPGSP